MFLPGITKKKEAGPEYGNISLKKPQKGDNYVGESKTWKLFGRME